MIRLGPDERFRAVCAGANSKGRGKAPALLLAVLGVAYRSTTSSDSILTGRAMLK